MIDSVSFWHNPETLAYRNARADADWRNSSVTTRMAAEAVRFLSPDLRLVLGGIPSTEAGFSALLEQRALLELFDAVAIHGFPLDDTSGRLEQWPDRLARAAALTRKPLWAGVVGVSCWESEQHQAAGLKRMLEALSGQVERLYLYTLLDPPDVWAIPCDAQGADGTLAQRRDRMGLLHADGRPKAALREFDPRHGVCQWFHFEDPRLELAVEWLRRLGVRRFRTAIPWTDWNRAGALTWFDRMLEALGEVDIDLILCAGSPEPGAVSAAPSPPLRPGAFAYFVAEVVSRYVLGIGLERRRPHREAWKAPVLYSAP